MASQTMSQEVRPQASDTLLPLSGLWILIALGMWGQASLAKLPLVTELIMAAFMTAMMVGPFAFLLTLSTRLLGGETKFEKITQVLAVTSVPYVLIGIMQGLASRELFGMGLVWAAWVVITVVGFVYAVVAIAKAAKWNTLGELRSVVALLASWGLAIYLPFSFAKPLFEQKPASNVAEVEGTVAVQDEAIASMDTLPTEVTKSNVTFSRSKVLSTGDINNDLAEGASYEKGPNIRPNAPVRREGAPQLMVESVAFGFILEGTTVTDFDTEQREKVEKLASDALKGLDAKGGLPVSKSVAGLLTPTDIALFQGGTVQFLKRERAEAKDGIRPTDKVELRVIGSAGHGLQVLLERKVWGMGLNEKPTWGVADFQRVVK